MGPEARPTWELASGPRIAGRSGNGFAALEARKALIAVIDTE
jgi:hypothetical protein